MLLIFKLSSARKVFVCVKVQLFVNVIIIEFEFMITIFRSEFSGDGRPRVTDDVTGHVGRRSSRNRVRESRRHFLFVYCLFFLPTKPKWPRENASCLTSQGERALHRIQHLLFSFVSNKNMEKKLE